MANNFFKIDKGASLAPQSSTPTSPSNGDIYYDSTLGFRKYENGTWSALGSGGGSGSGVNFIGLSTSWALTTSDDRDAESSLGNWSAYADAAGVSPVDMNGGSPTVTITRTTSVGEVLNGTASFKITKDAANRQGEGVSVLTNIPPAYRAANYTIYIPYKVISGSLTSGDLKVYIYDVTNGVAISPSNNDVFSNQGIAVATFTASTNTAQIRVGFHFASTSTTAVTLSFDDVVVGPASNQIGAAISDWVSYPLTIGATTTPPTKGTVVFDNARWRRVGDTMEIRYDYRQSAGGSAGSGTYLFPLPSGYTVDTSKLTPQTDGRSPVLGVAHVSNNTNISSNTNLEGVSLAYDNSNICLSFINPASAANIFQLEGSGLLPLGGETLISFEAKVPITGWASNLFISTSAFAASTDWAPFNNITASAGFGTISGVDVKYQRMGDTLFVRGFFTTGTVAASSGYIQLPSGYTIDVSKIAASSKGAVGYIRRVANNVNFENSGQRSSDAILFSDGSTTNQVFLSLQGDPSNIYQKSNVSTTGGWGNSEGVAFEFSVPIVGWTGGLQSGLPGSAPSTVRLASGNGHGSTATRIRRFSTVVENFGSDISYADSSTNGASFTINTSGIYAMSYTDSSSSTNFKFGLSKNSSELTTNIDSITAADRLIHVQYNSGQAGIVNTTVYLTAGTVIRPHDDSNTDGSGIYFHITKVSN